jgi:low temperature requirement protein LtrA
VVLAVATAVAGGGTDLLRERLARACLASAALFLISIWVPEPFRYLLWAIGIGLESGAMLAEDRDAARRVRRDHDLAALRPADPAEALEPHHFAERFGLFLIILLGEVVVEAGQGSVAVAATGATAGGWATLVAAMLLAAALWWLYFDSVAEINLRVLELSGGSPTMARAIFAVGHMLPAFARGRDDPGLRPRRGAGPGALPRRPPRALRGTNVNCAGWESGASRRRRRVSSRWRHTPSR